MSNYQQNYNWWCSTSVVNNDKVLNYLAKMLNGPPNETQESSQQTPISNTTTSTISNTSETTTGTQVNEDSNKTVNALDTTQFVSPKTISRRTKITTTKNLEKESPTTTTTPDKNTTSAKIRFTGNTKDIVTPRNRSSKKKTT